MWEIIKSEIVYAKMKITAGIIILIIFSIFALLDIKVFEGSSFIGKYLWAIFVSFGTYILVYLIWQIRIKEKRDRYHSQLPISINTISKARWLFAALPIFSVIAFLLIIQSVVNISWKIHISSIVGQLGLFSVLLAVIFLMVDLLIMYQNKGEIFKGMITFSLSTLAALGIFIVIVLTSPLLFEPIIPNKGEVLFFIWAIALSSASLIFYKKRKSFLE